MKTLEEIVSTTAGVLVAVCVILVALDAFRARPLYRGMFPRAAPWVRSLVFVAAWAIAVGIVWLACGGTAELFHGRSAWYMGAIANFVAIVVGLPLGAAVARSVKVMIVGESEWSRVAKRKLFDSSLHIRNRDD